MQKIEEILDYIKRNRLNVSQTEREAGIKKGRLDKWLKGFGAPKVEDFEKLQKWYDLNHKKSEKVPKDAPQSDLKPITDSGENYKEKYIATLERENLRLQHDLDASLGELRHNVLLTRAMSETTQELLVELLEKQNKKKRDDLLADVGIRNGEKYVKLKEEGKFAYVGK